MTSALKRNLLIGFGASLLILLLSSTASLISINNLFTSADLVSHTSDVVQKLEQTISLMKDAETGQRGFLITGKEEFLDPYYGTSEKVKTVIEQIKELTIDNPAQQQRIDQLDKLVNKRIGKLQELIDKRKATGLVSLADMQEGRNFMDSVRVMVADMTASENLLLRNRTGKLNRFSAATPILIAVAAFVAILITILFYIRMNKDITERAKLQEALLQKDAAISSRIKVIQEVSGKISSGDYTVRVDDSEGDGLGIISGALNRMASSLQTSFTTLSDREWLQTGVAGLNEAVVGDDNANSVARKILEFIAVYSNSQVGAFYARENSDLLTLQQGYALMNDNQLKKNIQVGEGPVGECAQSKKQLLVTGIQEDGFTVTFSAGGLRPANIIVFPLLFENEVNGVIELGSLQPYTERVLGFFKNISESVGIIVNTVQSRERVQQLLEETQSQAEELMTQQTELEQINAELEAQAHQLQTSEEELKVQSEELIETNTLLEEKSATLEQNNLLIRQKNAEIEKKAEDLALSTKYKSEFLANMSHELRTPLNSILLLSGLMSENNEKNLTADQVQYAKVIQGSGNGLLQLIDEILDLSKIEAGKMTVEWLQVPVTEITSDLQALFEPMAREKKLAWEIEVGVEVPAVIETDKLRLEQILKNLLSNAFKFTSEGYVRLAFSCPVDKPGFICCSVKDSGIGISPEKHELVFEAFRQEDGSTRRKYGGTGLGLSISRELSRLLGGELTLTSVPGEGSEFVCCIPLAKSTPRAAIQPEAQPQPVQQIDPYHAEHIPDEISDDRNNVQPGDRVILIIEDDTQFAGALLDYARQKNYKGIVAVRGDYGIEMAAKYRPAGILLDIQLPVKSGWQVMEALKGNPLTRPIPVHIMSSFEAKKESLVRGAVDFINKPVAFEKLNTIFEKIEFVLSRKEKKVLIIEENYRHARALAYYLGTYSVNAAINQSLEESISSLSKTEIDCVILDIGVVDDNTDRLLEKIRGNPGMEDLPIILFTGRNLSQPEAFRIKKYADAIVLKTANSYQRILDEVSLFLHMVEKKPSGTGSNFEGTLLKENVLKGKKVLLADDDVRNIYSMTKVLEKYQVEVIPAMDGKEALELMKKMPADIVLMDMMMPEMDGYQSIRAIRDNPLYRHTPIIAVTAKAMAGDREKCIAAGASDYISKPVDMDQLISLLRIWLYEKNY